VTATTATVELLTAEVRVLQVGSRQVTRSVFRQLDCVPAGEIEPFGRVSDSGNPDVIEVAGSHRGVLARSSVSRAWRDCGQTWLHDGLAACEERSRLWSRVQAARAAPVPAPAAPPQPAPPQGYPPAAAPPWADAPPAHPLTYAPADPQWHEKWQQELSAHQQQIAEAERQFSEHRHGWYVYRPSQELWERFGALSLIVLAGLR
jgi:hypothetical protein